MHTALVFAAGRGERLRPWTDKHPKPLYPVHGKAAIEHIICNVSKSGFKRLIINHAYLGWQIRHLIGTGSRFGIEVIYSPEPPGALETGGAIVNALDLLGNTPFITINSDIVTDFDFSTLTLRKNNLAHLVLVPAQADRGLHKDFGLNSTNQVTNQPAAYTFAGIACYHPQLFVGKKPGRFSLTPLLRQLVADNQASGEVYRGAWCEIGTYAQVQAGSL